MRALFLAAIFLSGILFAQQPVPLTSVSGRLLDEHGKPVPHAWKVLLQEQYIDGRKQLAPVPGSGGLTDAQGEFQFEGAWTGPVMLLFTPLQPSLREFAGIPETVALQEFSATYFPGTDDVSKAGRIELMPGARRGGLETRIVRAAANPVRGRVLDHSGQPAGNCTVLLLPDALAFLPMMSARIAKAPEGAFEFQDLPPGSYRLVAQLEAPRLIHRETISVKRGDRLEVRLPPPVRLEVQVSSKGATRLNPNWVFIGLQADVEGTGSLPPAVPIPGDGSKFAFDAVMPGRYRITASVADPRAPKDSFQVESIWYGDQPLTDEPVEITARPFPIRIVLVDGGTAALSGRD
jgi:hypothetical protein